MRAIDLYAGIGGWSLGLKLAGIDVVASYEWWQPAIDTHNGNHGGTLKPIDIRKLELSELPDDIDLVVGSPPCTEFSYANRGGSGNLAEGLKDIVKFFEIVEHLKPRFWAMENVPRVAEVLAEGFRKPESPLYRFRDLKPHIEVLDLSEFGAPQARRRCIAGNFDFDLLRQYQPRTGRRTLGRVVDGLARPVVTDPVWGQTLPRSSVTELQQEPCLNEEELRMNSEQKAFHPVYNNMAFPDPLDEPSRTVTATCTRVSRESIVIADPDCEGQFRRLTVRERACLQGFPISYQFYAKSFSEKAKMVGNAIPPTITYLIALATVGTEPAAFGGFESMSSKMVLPARKAPVTPPESEGRTYSASRSFRAAIPGLRFKSGMRFELANEIVANEAHWRVRFFFGSSKDIREIDLDGTAERELRRSPIFSSILAEIRGDLVQGEKDLHASDPDALQSVWNHRATGLHPYQVVDMLGSFAADIHGRLKSTSDEFVRAYIIDYVAKAAEAGYEVGTIPGSSKLEKYSDWIICGLIVGDWFNTLGWHGRHRAAA